MGLYHVEELSFKLRLFCQALADHTRERSVHVNGCMEEGKGEGDGDVYIPVAFGFDTLLLTPSAGISWITRRPISSHAR